MAQGVLDLLTKARPEWEPQYAKLVPDYVALQQALAGVDGKAQRVSGVGSEGYTDAKDAAEEAALDAAVSVLQGLRALQLDAPRPELTKVAGYTRSGLDKLRDQALADALAEITDVAAPLALAEEQVTAAQLDEQRRTGAAFGEWVGAPREQVVAGSSLRRQALDYLAEARRAIDRLDVRVVNLRATLPELVAQYEQQRRVVDASRGGGRGDGAAGA